MRVPRRYVLKKKVLPGNEYDVIHDVNNFDVDKTGHDIFFPIPCLPAWSFQDVSDG